VVQRLGTTPVIRRCLPGTRKINDRSRNTIYVALTRVIRARQIWLWEGIVWGTALGWWSTDVWDLVAVRLTEILCVVVIFDNHTTHAKRQLIVDEGAGVNRIID
jgi:hypothetical protein